MYKQVLTEVAFLQEVTWAREVPQLAAAPCCWAGVSDGFPALSHPENKGHLGYLWMPSRGQSGSLIQQGRTLASSERDYFGCWGCVGETHMHTHTFTQLETWCSQSPGKGWRKVRVTPPKVTRTALVLGRASRDGEGSDSIW